MKMKQAEEIEEEIVASENDICWSAIPIKYDNYPQEESDKYKGDIFGNIFDSPHFLYRRFHKNFCKAELQIILRDCKIDKNEPVLVDEVKVHLNKSFAITKVLAHNSIILLSSALECFLKDCFVHVLHYCHAEKLNGNDTGKMLKKYNFQNEESIMKAFSWLCPNFNSADYSIDLSEIFQLRHKIVHEGFYSDKLDKALARKYFFKASIFVDGFNDFMETNNYYEQIINPI